MDLDKDLAARQEARTLCQMAQIAQKELATKTQAQLDAIVEAVAEAFAAAAEELAELAVSETGFGNKKDKTAKNLFASRNVADAIRNLKTVGVLREHSSEKLWEVAVPVGVIAAIVPSTNPTATVCYKALIALKAGNAIVFSAHPKAIQCTLRAAQIVAQAAQRAGAPAGAVGCLSVASMAGCRELMEDARVRLILATGGPAMVKAAYSSGKPAIGVGAGNGPAYIHHSADIRQALACIAKSKTFDYGTVCASEQSVIVERKLEGAVVEEAQKMGFYFMSTDEAAKLARLLFRPDGVLNAEIVGRPAEKLAKMAGFSVPAGTQVLVAREEKIGEKYPYSAEKLCPILAFYVMDREEDVLRRVIEILEYEGAGHTFTIHAQDQDVIRRFATKVPVSRVLVNTPAALGGIGESTNLFPALTLGCGAVGGSSSSENIGPMELLNMRRVAWGVKGTQSAPKHAVDEVMVELLAQKILERLG